MPKSTEIGKSGVFVQSEVEERVKYVIEELNQNDFTALQEEAIPLMQKVLTSDTMKSARAQVSKDWGDFQSFGNVYMAEIKQRGQLFAFAQTTVTYKNVSVTYTITFDKDMKLAGLYMR